MSDMSYHEDPQGDYEVPMRRSDIDRLQANSARTEEAEARATRAERVLAFAEAGISVSDPSAQIFVNGYDGELTRDAIRAAAEPYGLLTPTPAPATPAPEPVVEEPPVTDAQRGQFAEREDLARSPARDLPPDDDTHPHEAAIAASEAMLADGATRPRAMGAFYNSVANAANAGDERVIIDRKSAQAIGGGGKEPPHNRS